MAASSCAFGRCEPLQNLNVLTTVHTKGSICWLQSELFIFHSFNIHRKETKRHSEAVTIVQIFLLKYVTDSQRCDRREQEWKIRN